MSSHFDFKEKKCWSCEYFCGGRDIESGVLFGQSIKCDYKAKCSNSKSINHDKEVSENSYCFSYHRWNRVESILDSIEESRARKQSEKQNDSLNTVEVQDYKQNYHSSYIKEDTSSANERAAVMLTRRYATERWSRKRFILLMLAPEIFSFAFALILLIVLDGQILNDFYLVFILLSILFVGSLLITLIQTLKANHKIKQIKDEYRNLTSKEIE